MAVLLTLCGHSFAHEWLPTYPELKVSFIPNVYVTTMKLFNKRADAEWYEVKVFDKNFNPIPFASPDRLIKVEYTKSKEIDVYIRDVDKENAVYICTNSKLIEYEVSVTIVNSRICSKIK